MKSFNFTSPEQSELAEQNAIKLSDYITNGERVFYLQSKIVAKQGESPHTYIYREIFQPYDFIQAVFERRVLILIQEQKLYSFTSELDLNASHSVKIKADQQTLFLKQAMQLTLAKENCDFICYELPPPGAPFDPDAKKEFFLIETPQQFEEVYEDINKYKMLMMRKSPAAALESKIDSSDKKSSESMQPLMLDNSEMIRERPKKKSCFQQWCCCFNSKKKVKQTPTKKINNNYRQLP